MLRSPASLCSRSENVLQSELQLAHVVSGPAYETRSGHKVANLPKVGRRCRAAAAPVHVRTCPRGMVQDVERFKAELKALPLCDREVLDGREIQVPNPRAGQTVAPHVAVLSGYQIGKALRIEPLVGTSLIGREIRIDAGRVKAVPVSLDDLAGGVPARNRVEGAAALGHEDGAGLPATHHLVEESAAIEKALTPPHRQFVKDRGHQTSRRIERRGSLLAAPTEGVL